MPPPGDKGSSKHRSLLSTHALPLDATVERTRHAITENILNEIIERTQQGGTVALRRERLYDDPVGGGSLLDRLLLYTKAVPPLEVFASTPVVVR
jgi:hypothetical protein